MTTQIRHYGNNKHTFGDDAGWEVWTTKTSSLALSRSQVCNLNGLLARDMAHLGDEHYAGGQRKIRIKGAATQIDINVFEAAFMPILLRCETDDDFYKYVQFDTPDCPELEDQIRLIIAGSISALGGLFGEKLQKTG